MIRHSDISQNVWVNQGEVPGNGVDDDNNGYIDDVYGWNFGAGSTAPSPSGECLGDTGAHGSHVAGIVGAVGNNGEGISGVAPAVRIMPLSVGEPDEGCRLSSWGVVQAIEYAVANGANIINLSLGGPFRDAAERDALRDASDANVLVVAAAGNEGLTNDRESIPSDSQALWVRVAKRDQSSEGMWFRSPSYPASFSREIAGVISVANLEMIRNNPASSGLYRRGLSPAYSATRLTGVRFDRKGIRYSGSPRPYDYSPGSSYGTKAVQIAAPGTAILSVDSASGSASNPRYVEKTGTSMASPVVAGAAAVVWAAFPNLNNLEVKDRLLRSARKDEALASYVEGGRQLDLYQALCGDMFSVVAAGCSGAGPTKPENPPKPPIAPIRKQPQPEKPEPVKEEKSSTDQLNDWIRGRDTDSEDEDDDSL